MIKIVCLLILLVTVVYSQSDEYEVNDEDKTSSRVNNMFSDIEQIEKAANAVKTGTQAGKAISKIKNFEDVKALTVNQLKSNLKEKVFKYKNAKAGFLKRLFDFANKTEKMLSGVNDKINEWNTTLPTIRAFGKSMRGMLDNTVEVFGDFEWSDLIDIDRKWNKRMESQLLIDKKTFFIFSNYLKKRYYKVNKESEEELKNYFLNLFVYDENYNNKYYIDALASAHEHRMIPALTLYNCSEALSLSAQILSRSYSLNDDGKSFEEAKNDSIESVLKKPKRTMQDERQLQAFIERHRQEIEVQTTELEQVLASLEQKYGRLHLRKAEIRSMENESYYTTIDRMLATKKTEFTSIDQYRESLLKK